MANERKRNWMRPYSYGNVWDKMTKAERRFAVRSDLVLGFGGAAIIWIVASYIQGG